MSNKSQEPSYQAASSEAAPAQTLHSATRNDDQDALVGPNLYSQPLGATARSPEAQSNGLTVAQQTTDTPTRQATPIGSLLQGQWDVNDGAGLRGTDVASGSVLNTSPTLAQHPEPASNAHGSLGGDGGSNAAPPSTPQFEHPRPIAVRKRQGRLTLQQLEEHYPPTQELRSWQNKLSQKAAARAAQFTRQREEKERQRQRQQALAAAHTHSHRNTSSVPQSIATPRPEPSAASLPQQTTVHWAPAPAPAPPHDSTQLATTNANPPPTNSQRRVQLCTSVYQSYQWPVRLYNVDLDRAGCSSARDWILGIISTLPAFCQWHAHVSVGFIEYGDISSVLVLHNAFNPFSPHNLVKTTRHTTPQTTSLGVYESNAKQIFWWTVEPALHIPLNECVRTGIMRQFYKWTLTNNPKLDRFHKGYFFAATKQNLGGLLNRGPIEPENREREKWMTYELQRERLEKITNGNLVEGGYAPDDFEPSNDSYEDIAASEAQEIWNKCLLVIKDAEDGLARVDWWDVASSDHRQDDSVMLDVSG